MTKKQVPNDAILLRKSKILSDVFVHVRTRRQKFLE